MLLTGHTELQLVVNTQVIRARIECFSFKLRANCYRPGEQTLGKFLRFGVKVSPSFLVRKLSDTLRREDFLADIAFMCKEFRGGTDWDMAPRFEQ